MSYQCVKVLKFTHRIFNQEILQLSYNSANTCHNDQFYWARLFVLLLWFAVAVMSYRLNVCMQLLSYILHACYSYTLQHKLAS